MRVRLPRIDWTVIAALPLVVVTVGVLVGMVWLASILGAGGWGLLGFLLIGLLVQLHRDRFSRTDSSGEMVYMPTLTSRTAEDRARPGLPNWLYVTTSTPESRIEFRSTPTLRRIIDIALICGAMTCFLLAFIL